MEKRNLLVHGLDSMELAKLEVLGNFIKVVDSENAGGSLKQILEGEKIKAENELPDEKVIIFSGYDDDSLKENIEKFRQIFPERPILAVVTEHSINWSFEFLLKEHLIKDRDFNRENHKKYLEEMEKENKRIAEEKSRKEE